MSDNQNTETDVVIFDTTKSGSLEIRRPSNRNQWQTATRVAARVAILGFYVWYVDELTGRNLRWWLTPRLRTISNRIHPPPPPPPPHWQVHLLLEEARTITREAAQ